MVGIYQEHQAMRFSRSGVDTKHLYSNKTIWVGGGNSQLRTTVLEDVRLKWKKWRYDQVNI